MWEEGDGAVKEVTRVLDVAALELDLGVREPELDAAGVDVECSFKDRACAGEFALMGL